MILLTPQGGNIGRHSLPVFLLFGAGTVGAAILAEVQQFAPFESRNLPLDWKLSTTFSDQLTVIESMLDELLATWKPDGEHPHRLNFIWSAGAAGFAATDEQVSRELILYRKVLSSIERMTGRYPTIPATMVLMSSAGGLFEGQRGVTACSKPQPIRPYSRLKLQQEELLMQSSARLTKLIYRLTSVYGYIRNHQRRGLIPTLVANGLAQRVSQITGFSMTMRDYIWIEDVAKYITRILFEDPLLATDSVATLASCKPSSILEIQHVVEKTICRPLYLRYSPEVTNGVTMSFDTDVLPSHWSPSELATNVRKIVNDVFTHHNTFLATK